MSALIRYLRHEQSKEHFAQIFHMVFTENSSDFINHPDFTIINYLTDDETFINKSLNQEELFKSNMQRLLSAYNRWKGTHLKIDQVDTLCRSLPHN